eukprot:2867378-Prymnesium_polylepis.1
MHPSRCLTGAQTARAAHWRLAECPVEPTCPDPGARHHGAPSSHRACGWRRSQRQTSKRLAR